MKVKFTFLLGLSNNLNESIEEVPQKLGMIRYLFIRHWSY